MTPYAIEYTRDHGVLVYPTKGRYDNCPRRGRGYVLHRTDGPAMIYRDGTVEYWIDGGCFGASVYWDIINKYKALPNSVKKCHMLEWVRKL